MSPSVRMAMFRAAIALKQAQLAWLFPCNAVAMRRLGPGGSGEREQDWHGLGERSDGGRRLRRGGGCLRLDGRLGEGRVDPPADTGGDRLLGANAAVGAALRGRLDAVGGFEMLDPLGQFACRGKRLGTGLGGRAGEGSLEPVARGREFGQVRLVDEGLAEAGIVVAELALGDGQVLSRVSGLAVVAADQPVEG